MMARFTILLHKYFSPPLLSRPILGGADVTPDPVDWANVSGPTPLITTPETITGISTGITLSFNITTNDGLSFYYRKNSVSWIFVSSGTGVNVGSVAVSNNDVLEFKADNPTVSGGILDVEIINDSDGSALIDSIRFEFIGGL